MTTLKMKDLVEARIEEVSRQNPNWEPGLLLLIVRGFIADVSKRVAAQDIPFSKFPADSMDLVGKMNVDFDRERDTINVKVISSASDDGQSPMDQIDSCVRDYFYIHLFQRISRYVVMEQDGHEYKARFLMQSQAPSGESALEEAQRLKSILARPFVVGREELPLEELDENGSVRTLGHTPVLVFPRSNGSSAEILGLEVEFKPLTMIQGEEGAFYPIQLRVTGNTEALASLDEESFSWLCGMAVKEIDKAIKLQADLNKLGPQLHGLLSFGGNLSQASGHDLAGAENHPGANSAIKANCCRLDGTAWVLIFNGVQKTFSKRKGFAYLQVFFAHQGREITSKKLAQNIAGNASTSDDRYDEEGWSKIWTLSNQPVMDESYKEKLLARVVELREDREAALSLEDGEEKAKELERIDAETDRLSLELRINTGKQGRSREFTKDDHKAQNAVSQAIREVKKIMRENGMVDLCDHLDRHLRTGFFCSYDPNPPVDWVTE